MLTHKGTLPLFTARLALRRFRPGDAENFFGWARDPKVSEYVTWNAHASLEETENLLTDWIGQYDKPDYYHWAVEGEGRMIGTISLMPKSGGSAEIGYGFGREHWGRGYASEAAAAVRDFAFGEIGFHRLMIRHVRENPASGEVALKCGFSDEGIEREAFSDRDGRFHDILRASLLRDEWERLKKGPDCILETERLILRAPEPGDFAPAHAYSSDPENTKYIFWGPNTPADTRRFLRLAQTEWAKREPRQYDFFLVRKEDGQLIGGCGLSVSGSLGEIGWILERSFQHNGYATEAARAVLGLGFQKLGLHRIRARCDARNEPSFRVMERLGMRREAVFRSARPARGEWQDEYEYAILGEEWEE